MFKKLLTLLASLIIVPVLALGPANSFAPAFADEEEGEGEGETELPEREFEYVESGSKEDGYIYRTYLTPELSPSLYRRFKKPFGYTVKTTFDENVLEYLVNEMVELDLDNGPAIMPAYYYHIFGSRVFVDTGYFTGNNTEENQEQFREDIANLTIFSVEECDGPVEIQFEMNVRFSTSWGDATFKILSDVYVFEPYTESDLVEISADYYQAEGGNDIRVTVWGKPMRGLFIEDWFFYNDYQNPDGYPLDDDYEITIFANGVPLSAENDYYAEMSFPSKPFDVTARLRFKSEGVTYSFFSKSVTVADPCADVLVDGYHDRDQIEKDSEHVFSLGIDNFDLDEMLGGSCRISLYPVHLALNDDIIILWDEMVNEPGVEGQLYYIPSPEENAAHELNDDLTTEAPGQYVTWGYDYWEDKEAYVWYDFEIFSNSTFDFEYYGEISGEMFEPGDEDVDVAAMFQETTSIPYIGRWMYFYQAMFGNEDSSFLLETVSDKFLDVVDKQTTQDKIVLDVEDEINLVAGTGSIQITPTVVTERTTEVNYYYGYEVNKEGVLEIEQDENGVLTINPINYGLVELTVYEECRLYSRISKTITIRVLDTVFDVSKLEIPNEFHYAGKDLTASISVRGFTNILNLDIQWTVLGKDGEPIPEEKYQVNSDASMTIPKAERNDYTITASYEGIELGTQVVEVRKINVNQLLRTNIWWICLITIGLVAIFFFFKSLLKRGKTTVQSIQKVYDVFCGCMSDDKLTLSELKRIKREITRCLHRCEDLNIEALNQYEKAIRYLRKSLNDTKPLVKKWDTISVEDKSVFIDKLDKDLAKALNVAKEIENAKELIEQYHNKANRSNYEVLQEEKPDKKSRKKDN